MQQDIYAPLRLQPSLANHFRVTFWIKNKAGYATAPQSFVLDAAFQRISGLSRELGVEQQSSGGENLRNNYLATKITHGSLLLERGVMSVTPLSMQFEHMMRGGEPFYCNVFIHLLNDMNIPVANWGISNALPVSWKTGDFNASDSKVLINSIELRYQEMFWLGVRV